MPTIPTIQRQGARSVRAVAADVGQGLTQAGRAVLMIDEQMQQARKSRELNEVVTEATRRIAENEDTLKADPGAFTTWSEQQREFLTTTRSELSDSLGDAEVRDLFNQKFNTMGVHSETRIRQGARGREIDEGRSAIAAMEDVLSDNYATLASGVDRQAVLDGVEAAFDEAADTGILTDTEAEQRKQLFLNRAEQLRVLADINNDPAATLEAIDAGQYALEEQDRRIAVERAGRDVARAKSAEATAFAKQQQETWTTIFDGIDQDKMGRAEIDVAYNTIDPATGLRGLSDPGKRALLGRLRQHNKNKLKLDASFSLYQKSIQGGAALDYKLKDHRDAAEAGFLRLAPELVELEPQVANTRIINELLRPTKIWPKSLQSQMRIATKHGSMDTVESFSNLYDRVSNDPTVSAVNKSMVPEDQAFWETVGSLRQAGMLSNDAIELAKHSAYEMTDDERLALKQRYKSRKYRTEGNRNSFDQVLNQWDPTAGELAKLPNIGDINWSNLIAGAPAAPPGMVADYENLTRMFYDFTGGDIELSRKLAGENLARAWATEEVDE